MVVEYVDDVFNDELDGIWPDDSLVGVVDCCGGRVVFFWLGCVTGLT